MFKGIDVSKWNGTVDWKKVKTAGINFVMIRDGFGKKSPAQVDKRFKENLTKDSKRILKEQKTQE